MGGGSFIEDSHPIKRREIVILFIASSYESWDKLQLSGSLDSSTQTFIDNSYMARYLFCISLGFYKPQLCLTNQ